MPHIIAFSGVGNTGKTTIIKKMDEYFTGLGYRVKINHEPARNCYHILEEKGMYDFQLTINKEEIKRLNELKQHKSESEFDLIFVDRTTVDNHIYYNFNKSKNNWDDNDYDFSYDNIYDLVFFFEKEFALSANENLLLYNDEMAKISADMKREVNQKYNTINLDNAIVHYDFVIDKIKTMLN